MESLLKLFDMSVDLLAVAGTDGYFKRLNPAFERVLGFNADELMAKPFIEFVHPEDRAATLREVEKLSQGEKTLRFENRYRCKDGSYKWLSWTSAPNEDGYVYAVARDVTEAKRSLDHLMNDLPGMVYRCRNDPDWSMEFVSDGCHRLTGYNADQILGDMPSYGSLIHAEDRQRVWDEVQAAIGRGREFQIEYRIVTADCGTRVVWERGRAIHDAAGNLKALQGFITDVTETRKLRDEITQLQKMESLGQLTGGVAHDFNNLLAIVIGNLELLEEDTAANPRELLGEALQAAWRGAELSQRLLAFSRRQMLAPEVVSVTDLLRGTESLLRRALGESIDIEIDVPRALPHVLVDAGQLENAVLNLAINARDAMPAGGQLRIHAARLCIDRAEAGADAAPGPYVMIEVSDSGTGMSEETRTRAFEPFFTTKEPGKGTGLGLSMVYGFLRQSGGHARLWSEPGQGTRVQLYLPECVAKPTMPAQESLADSLAPRECLLVVEDNAAVRKMLVRQLHALGYATFEASTGADALAVLEREHKDVDLLLTDVVMPGGMSGVELAEKSKAAYPHLRVLLTSGFSERQSVSAAQLPLLAKPYKRQQLAAAVRTALGTRNCANPKEMPIRAETRPRR